MTISLLEIGLIIGLLFSVIALFVALKTFSVVRKQFTYTEKMTEKLAREIGLSTTSSVSMGQRLLAVERRLQIESLQTNKTQSSDGVDNEEQAYSQAAELFKLGVECDEVARRCGLSRAEASLIQMMQLHTSDVK